VVGGIGLAAACAQEAGAAPAPGLAVEVELDGQTYRYDSAAGIDLGAYADPLGQFVQDCVRVDHPQLPLSIFFRPDRGSDRLEVVFEVGRCWGTQEPKNLSKYRARIIRGPAALATVDVPGHTWFARWRWQSAPRPIRAKPAALMDQWLMPQLSERLRPASGPMRPQGYEPMGLADLAAYMGSTGERPEIGLITEAQAQYLCTGSQAALDTLLAQAEAAGTYPWNVRDEKTSAPVDVFAYPRVTLYGPQAGNPYIKAAAKTDAVADAAHQPALSFLPFLLTGDPYHLEQIQLIASWNVIWRPWDYRYRTTQIRGEAWSMRTLMQATKATPASVPKWLLPQAYWQKLLGSYLDWYLKTFVNNPEPPRAIFRTTEQGFGGNEGKLVAGTFGYPWQDEFLVNVFGWMVLMGFTQWRPIFEWKIGSTIARTNGQSGWPRSECTPYRMVMRPTAAAPWVTDWKQAWDLTAAGLEIKLTDADALDLTQLFYFPYTRGALVLAKHLEIANVAPSLEWAEGELPRAQSARKPFPYKWAMV
jgi:hypothetical protein